MLFLKSQTSEKGPSACKKTSMSSGKLQKEKSILIVIDIQEKLMPVIDNKEDIFNQVNKLIKGAELLELPIIYTEQYPKGLGNICEEIKMTVNNVVVEKNFFSCALSNQFMQLLKGKTQFILCGVESHICILKTALDMIDKGFEVHIVADAVSSRMPTNKLLALERMKQSGAFIESVEMVLFQLLDDSGNEIFKQISKLIK